MSKCPRHVQKLIENVLDEMQFTEMSLAIFLLYLAVSDMWITSVHTKKAGKQMCVSLDQPMRLLNSCLLFHATT